MPARAREGEDVMAASGRTGEAVFPASGRPGEAVTPAGGTLANDAWEALLSAHGVLMKQFLAEDTWEDISMREYDVLYTLSKRREPLRMSELNRGVLLSQPALSRLVDRLAGRGLVERCSDAQDGRGVRLSLTDAGRALQRRVGRRHARSIARAMTAALDRAELRQLEQICQKLAREPAATGAAGHCENEDTRP